MMNLVNFLIFFIMYLFSFYFILFYFIIIIFFFFFFFLGGSSIKKMVQMLKMGGKTAANTYQCLKLSQKSCRSLFLEPQIINMKLKKNQQNFQVHTKSCRLRTGWPVGISNTDTYWLSKREWPPPPPPNSSIESTGSCLIRGMVSTSLNVSVPMQCGIRIYIYLLCFLSKISLTLVQQ